jgi:hypothetical protein
VADVHDVISHGVFSFSLGPLAGIAAARRSMLVILDLVAEVTQLFQEDFFTRAFRVRRGTGGVFFSG